MGGDVRFDVLAWDVVGYEGAVGEREVREGHGDCGDVCTVSVRI
jgi:hypothetical protein